MITRAQAIDAARAFLVREFPDLDEGLHLYEPKESRHGWVFYWTSERYHRTRAFEDMLAGNAPLLVLSRDGSVHALGTALEPEKALAEPERTLRL